MGNDFDKDLVKKTKSLFVVKLDLFILFIYLFVMPYKAC